ncbi:DUF535 family protein [Massilia sp. S19_KUP03_FR1]|uniref:DUF535 family protein n=1 Tax=Massilia sp. S19_KUP03_FR1 TaxID=3025503 RepID=UPI002FCDD324
MNLSDHLHWIDATVSRRATPPVTLASGVAPEVTGIARARELLKLHLRALPHRAATRRWLTLLNSHPVFSELVRQRPSIVNKIYRPYLTATLNVEQRLAVLAAHYGFMFSRGLAALLAQASRSGFLLARIPGKTGIAYEVQLRAAGTCEREGELVLQLHCAGAVVYSTAFTFEAADGVARVTIGCLQGPRGDDAMGAIKQATRELHGLRAKALLVGLVQQLGYALGCTELRLVGNGNRTAGRAIGRGHVRANYEQLWQELGACPRADGDFSLPCAPLAPLALELVAQKRRSEARKRHQMLQDVSDDVIDQFTGRGRPALALLAA